MAEEFKDKLTNEAWDDLYFAFVKELFDCNTSRYEAQARDLIERNSLVIDIDGTRIRYRLSFRECLCDVSIDKGSSFLMKSRTRMGWRRAKRLEELPLLFAKTEASLIYKS